MGLNFILPLPGLVSPKDIGSAGRHPFIGPGWTGPGNGALVAIQTSIVPHLQIQGAIAKGVTAFHAFTAANT